MRMSGYSNIPGAPGGQQKDLADIFRTMEFQYGRDGQPGLAGLQPVTPPGYTPTGVPIPMGGVLSGQMGNVAGMGQNPQDVAFLGNLFNKPVMPDNSVEFGGKKIDKNFYEQLKNNPEKMQEYIRQQYLEEGGKKYF
jgi:hypothetical protein